LFKNATDKRSPTSLSLPTSFYKVFEKVMFNTFTAGGVLVFHSLSRQLSQRSINTSPIFIHLLKKRTPLKIIKEEINASHATSHIITPSSTGEFYRILTPFVAAVFGGNFIQRIPGLVCIENKVWFV
jgi:hypothetical protein